MCGASNASARLKTYFGIKNLWPSAHTPSRTFFSFRTKIKKIVRALDKVFRFGDIMHRFVGGTPWATFGEDSAQKFQGTGERQHFV
jgi:hypothetical protein